MIPVYFKTSSAFYVGCYQDDARYINYARTIAKGETSNIAFINNDEKFNYMPGYSFFLSLIIRLFKYDLNFFRLFSILFTLTGLLFFYKILLEIKKLPVELSVISVIIFSLSFTLFQFSGAVLSDPLFFCLVFIYLWYVSKNEKENKFGLKECIISGIILGYIFLTRPVGLSMIAATIIYFIYKNRIKPLFIILLIGFFTIGLVFLILHKHISFWTFNIFFNFYNTKSVENVTLFKHLYKSIRAYYLMVPYNFFSVPSNRVLQYLVSSIFTLIILVKSFKAKINLINIFAIIYTFILFSWIDAEYRYLISLVPFLIYGIISWLSENFQKKITYIISLLFIMYLVIINYYISKEIEIKPYLQTINWINLNIKNKNNISITIEGDRFFLLSNIKTIRFSSNSSFVNTVNYILTNNIQYIVHNYASNINRFPIHCGDVIRNQLKIPGTFKLLYQNPAETMVIYEIIQNKSTFDELINNNYLKAEKLIKNKDYLKAINLLKKTIETWEDFSYGYSVIGNCYFLLHDYKKMQEYYDKIIELNLYEPEILLQYAENLILINDITKLNKIRAHIENQVYISDNSTLMEKFKKIYKIK